MSSAERRRIEHIHSPGQEVPSDHVRVEAAALKNQIRVLQRLVVNLQDGLDALTEVQTHNVESGIDFYDEVRLFEIELIKRALKSVNGHQRKAARLLNLNATTLGAKIKRYGIQLGHPAFFKET
jgi:transcriptional regulator with GAF, ATPase, and Fis domain